MYFKNFYVCEGFFSFFFLVEMSITASCSWGKLEQEMLSPNALTLLVLFESDLRKISSHSHFNFLSV